MTASDTTTGYPDRVERVVVVPSALVDRGWSVLLPLHIVLIAGVGLAALAVLWLRLYEPNTTHDMIALACGFGVIALIGYTRVVLQVPWSSASIVYLALFWMFHYGLAVTAVLVPSVLDPIPGWQVAWLFWPSTRVAMLLGLLGASAFVLALGLVTLAGRSTELPEAQRQPAHDPALYWIGWIVMTAGLVASAVTFFTSGGLALLTLSYGQFRSTMLGPTNFQAAVNLSQLGCLAALCGAGGRRWIAPLLAWMPLAGLMLLLGLRTEAFVPLVTFAIVLTHRGVRFHRGVLLSAAVASLVLIPAIKAIRAVGFSNRTGVDLASVSPLSTLTELGSTLRAARAYIDWIDQGDEYLLGASYWAPIDRQMLTRLIPGREQVRADADTRVPARNIAEREGSVGASSTGEAYYNFGDIGPVIFYACVGALFAWLERRAAVSAYGAALLGTAMLLLYFNIRDQWLPVPGRATVALALFGFCGAISLLHRRRSAID